MANSELNKLSKRQILESLYYEQSQSTATLSRFFTSIARLQGISPEDLAKTFAEDEANQEYVQKFNNSMRELQTKKAAPVANVVPDSGATQIDDSSPKLEEGS